MAALKQIVPLKSPRLDSFNPGFYQTYWHNVGDKVTYLVLNFWNNGCFDNAINFTYIVFIPKKKNSVYAFDYRPISFCNVIYTFIFKMLANKLKLILPTIIFKNQSAFIPRWLITDNIIVTYEALHMMKTRKKDRKWHMAIKLDISKAYDKVE